MMHARRRTPFTALNVDPSMGFFAPIFVSLSRHLISHTLEVKQALLFLFFSSFRKLNQTCSLAVQAKRKNRGMVDFWNREKGRIENEDDTVYRISRGYSRLAFIKNGRLKLFPGCLELFIRLHRRGESRPFPRLTAS